MRRAWRASSGKMTAFRGECDVTGVLDTRVDGDPGSCRATADWLSKVGHSVTETGSAIRRARGSSESCWAGPAGDAFRNSTLSTAKDADDLRAIGDRAGQALLVFAADLNTVRARMTQARNVAVKGGLGITPDRILPPGLPPGPAPVRIKGPIQPHVEEALNRAIDAHGAAVAQHARQVAAYNEAKTTVEDARKIEIEAHRKLQGIAEPTRFQANALKVIGVTALSGTLSLIKSLHTTAKDLLNLASSLDTQASTFAAASNAMSSTHASRVAAARVAATSAAGAQSMRELAERLLKPVSWIPESTRAAISYNPGQHITVTRHSSPILKGTKVLLTALPVAGTLAAVGSAVGDVLIGKPPLQAAAETAAGISGSIAGGAALGSALGTVFPGVGNVVGGVVGGIGGGLVAVFGVGNLFK